MLINRDDVAKGGFGKLTKSSDEFLVLHRRVSALKGKRNFKIGITSNPVKRAANYDSDHPDKYHQMVVLYETGSHDRVRKLETMLICKHRKDSDNEIGGGGGSKGRGKRYYLYIVRSLTRAERIRKHQAELRKHRAELRKGRAALRKLEAEMRKRWGR